jgi:hypothetical protein
MIKFSALDRQTKIDNDFADGLIVANTFNRISNVILQEKAYAEKELLKVEELLEDGTSFKLKVLELLRNLSNIYENCGIKEKNQFLRVLFPEGFTLNEEITKVLTPTINKPLVTIDSISSNYKFLEIKKRRNFTYRPLWGGRRDYFRIFSKDMQLLKIIEESDSNRTNFQSIYP